jgi:hypothetical protein
MQFLRDVDREPLHGQPWRCAPLFNLAPEPTRPLRGLQALQPEA